MSLERSIQIANDAISSIEKFLEAEKKLNESLKKKDLYTDYDRKLTESYRHELKLWQELRKELMAAL